MRIYYSQQFTIQITFQNAQLSPLSEHTADILSTDTVKWHKTEECIQIYNLNFLYFAFFFHKFLFMNKV